MGLGARVLHRIPLLEYLRDVFVFLKYFLSCVCVCDVVMCVCVCHVCHVYVCGGVCVSVCDFHLMEIYQEMPYTELRVCMCVCMGGRGR